MDPFPEVPAALLDALNRLFPERSADALTPESVLRFQGGERSVVRFLQAKFDEQNRTSPEYPDDVSPEAT